MIAFNAQDSLHALFWMVVFFCGFWEFRSAAQPVQFYLAMRQMRSQTHTHIHIQFSQDSQRWPLFMETLVNTLFPRTLCT